MWKKHQAYNEEHSYKTIDDEWHVKKKKTKKEQPENSGELPGRGALIAKKGTKFYPGRERVLNVLRISE